MARHNTQRPAGCVSGIVSGQSGWSQGGHRPGVWGSPILANGFIDIGMTIIVHDSGLGQRRCERAIRQLREAGFMRVTPPRGRSDEGQYFGCRAIRGLTTAFFEWRGPGPMLRRERARASEALRRKAQQANRKLADFMCRVVAGARPIFKRRQAGSPGNNGSPFNPLRGLRAHFVPNTVPNRMGKMLGRHRP